MPERIRFHLDENVDPAIALGLKKAGVDITTSKEANLLSRSDIAQLEFARSESRVLVTHDDDFLILNSKGIEHHGIVYCRKSDSDRCPHQRGSVLCSIVSSKDCRSSSVRAITAVRPARRFC